MNDMPTTLPTPETTLPSPEAPVETVPVVETAPEGLTPPAHEEKVQIINPEDDNASVVPVPLTKQVIEVVASRKGFYGQQRIVTGQPFSVASEEELGDWMTCKDPEIEKRRRATIKLKKKKAKV